MDISPPDNPDLRVQCGCRADMRRNRQFDIPWPEIGCIHCLDYEVLFVLQDFSGVGNVRKS